MRAPAFWGERRPSLAATLLRPAASIYGAIAAARLRRTGERVGVPVICVGNFTAGGAGKTPTALAAAHLLQAIGERPAFLTRGYGGRTDGPAQVDPRGHGTGEVGDEPLLLARVAPTVVARDRAAGARLCLAGGATVIVMDDGLQNRSLHKDLTFAVVDAGIGVGNGLCLPAGPLRAPLRAQWPLVDAVVVIGDGEAGDELAREAERQGKPAYRARLEPDPAVAASLRGRRVLAFAGIGRPAKFFTTLEACGAALAKTRGFPDHHRYTPADLALLRADAEAAGLTLVTTEKDMTRLAALGAEATNGIVALPVTLVFADHDALRALGAPLLRKASGFAPPAHGSAEQG